jgi:hypothetical protein
MRLFVGLSARSVLGSEHFGVSLNDRVSNGVVPRPVVHCTDAPLA